jgi:hypothetical protein
MKLYQKNNARRQRGFFELPVLLSDSGTVSCAGSALLGIWDLLILPLHLMQSSTEAKVLLRGQSDKDEMLRRMNQGQQRRDDLGRSEGKRIFNSALQVAAAQP